MSAPERQGVAGPDTAADAETVPYRCGYQILAQPDSLPNRSAQREMRGDCGR